jgi:hypothetical protein
MGVWCECYIVLKKIKYGQGTSVERWHLLHESLFETICIPDGATVGKDVGDLVGENGFRVGNTDGFTAQV